MSATGRIEDTHQPSLLQVYPQGFYRFPAMLDTAAQARMILHARRLAREAPLYTPRNQYAQPYRLQITNWGPWGWTDDETNGRRYVRNHPETGRPWPSIPPEVRALMKNAAREAGCPSFEPDTVLMNFYPAGDENPGRLGLHRDSTERNQDAPIVTLSLGASAVFLLGGERYNDPTQEIVLDGGDVVVMAPPARAFYHAVDHLLAKPSPDAAPLKGGGRISFTARQYLFN
jgi:alkylated DNA repair protein (DNA oxidative demethylase)